MPACTHTLTTRAADGPWISRAQQPPCEGASHERPLGQMPFPCDSCQACRNQLLLLQQLVPGPFAASCLTLAGMSPERASCRALQVVGAGPGLCRHSQTGTPTSSRGCTGRFLLPLLCVEMESPGTAGFLSGCPLM